VLSAGAFKRCRSPKVAIKWNRTYLMGKTVLPRREKGTQSTVEAFCVFVCVCVYIYLYIYTQTFTHLWVVYLLIIMIKSL